MYLSGLIELVDNISLFGGFNYDFSERKLSDKTFTSVQNTENPTSSSFDVKKSSAFRSEFGISKNTVVDGYYIAQSKASRGNEATLYISGGSAPSLQNIFITGCSPYVLYIESASPMFLSNMISGIDGTSPNTVFAIFTSGASYAIYK